MPEFNRDAAVQASSLLESIPKMFSQTQHADACVGAAVQASIDTLKVCLAFALVLHTSSACSQIFQAGCRTVLSLAALGPPAERKQVASVHIMSHSEGVEPVVNNRWTQDYSQ